MNPQGVTLTYKGDILVTDSNNQCVQVGGGLAGTETDKVRFSDVQQLRGPHIQVGGEGEVSRTATETDRDCGDQSK